MDLTSVVDDMFSNPSKFPIRIDKKTNMASVLDVIRMITNCASSDAKKTLTRLDAALGTKFGASGPQLRINGSGRATLVANAQTLVQIIWELPGKAARDFRRSSAHYICRLLGSDLSLAREIEERHSTVAQPVKDFFMSRADESNVPVANPTENQSAEGGQDEKQSQGSFDPSSATNASSTQMVVHTRPCIKICGADFEVATEDDSDIVKQLLTARLQKAFEMEMQDLDVMREKRAALARLEMEATETRLVLANRAMEEDMERQMVCARETSDYNRKRSAHEFAIENCNLVSKRTKAVYQVLNTLKGYELIHPSLMTAAIGSISNLAAEAAGVGQKSPDPQAPAYLEDFSTMSLNMFNTVLDLKKLAAIGKRVAAEYRNRYGGKNPDRVVKQVNGAMRHINVYEAKDRDWIEAIMNEFAPK